MQCEAFCFLKGVNPDPVSNCKPSPFFFSRHVWFFGFQDGQWLRCPKQTMHGAVWVPVLLHDSSWHRLSPCKHGEIVHPPKTSQNRYYNFTPKSSIKPTVKDLDAVIINWQFVTPSLNAIITLIINNINNDHNNNDHFLDILLLPGNHRLINSRESQA